MNKELLMLNLLFFILMMMILFFFSLNLMKLHPIIIIMNLLIFNLLIILNMSMWQSNYLYSIMLFLIMISGMLIIFLYFSSLISNEKINIKLNWMLSISLILNFMFFFINNNILNFYNLYIKKFCFNEINPIIKINEMNFQNILNLYEYPFNNFTILTMFYLLITLFSIIKICSTKSLPMRKITN